MGMGLFLLLVLFKIEQSSHNVMRTLFDFLKDLADVLSDESQAEELNGT
jgi:hypothetical protein